MKNILSGFKDFVSRGNAVELAVAVVVGAAFSAVVKAIQDGLISPIIGAIVGKSSLADLWHITLRGDSQIDVGGMLDAALQFLVTMVAIYLLIVLPLNALAARRKKGLAEEPKAPAEDILLLQEIRDLLAGSPNAAVRNDAGPAPTA